MSIKSLSSVGIFGARTPLVDDYIESCNRLKLTVDWVVRVDDNPPRVSRRDLLVKLDELSESQKSTPFVAAAFSPERRRELVSMAVDAGFSFSAALIDSSTVVASTSRVGDGSFLNAMSVVASNTRIGQNVFINRACNLGHHIIVGDYVSFGPGVTVTSNVKIGTGAVIGAGSVLLPGVSVGDNAIVSAGTRIAQDVPESHMAIGHEPVLKPLEGPKRKLYYPDQE